MDSLTQSLLSHPVSFYQSNTLTSNLYLQSIGGLIDTAVNSFDGTTVLHALDAISDNTSHPMVQDNGLSDNASDALIQYEYDHYQRTLKERDDLKSRIMSARDILYQLHDTPTRA